ncbi:gamma-glutamylcyclotransferase family protein [Aidingimonas halophila]|uniref:Gamma-glutamyl cyclotransferase, AIG2-like n=1 Tax=Aidingimonas halophila TaxID=574349 RepID=A0A1H3BK59_9GAMM|nr:gamma-glutamylcyclotransferase family protein [Aidingimonas halophila]GHC26694.1 hypothetical protein GCM10008094_17590 [Aidingimonas halophila]SDX42342.1 Gamma-glutamyl cyclotransferase, AIG2-like [Aidingimonas halophila]
MRRWRYLLAAIAGVPVCIALYLWLTLLSPFLYERPDSLDAIEPGTHQVFVYGTLQYAPVRWLVYGRSGNPETVYLENFRRDGLDLEPVSGSRVEGLLLTVDEKELAKLDRYERLGIRYERQRLTLSDGSRAWVYIRR